MFEQGVTLGIDNVIVSDFYNFIHDFSHQN